MQVALTVLFFCVILNILSRDLNRPYPWNYRFLDWATFISFCGGLIALIYVVMSLIWQ